MQCDQFERRMQRLLDLRGCPEQDHQLQMHAEFCSECRQRLMLQRDLFAALEFRELPELGEDFAEQVVSQVVESRRRPSMTPRGLLALAAAAALLLATLPAAWVYQRATHPPAVSEIQSPPSRQLASNSQPNTSISNVPPGSDWWIAQTESLLGLYPPQIRQKHRQQVDRLADDLRPLATSFTAAVAALRRSIPVGKTSEKPQPQAATEPLSWFDDLS